MPLTPRTVPTHVRAADKLVDLGVLSLTATQGLNVLGGGLLGFELLVDASGLPLAARQALAVAAVLLGLLGAFWRIDGKSLWTWLLITLRYARFPRKAVWRPAPLDPRDRRGGRWHDLTPQLAWPSTPSAVADERSSA
jgi:hypothetical protein